LINMKIMFVIASLADAGGAERVLSIMANYWAEKGRDITIVTYDERGVPPFYPLSDKIEQKFLEVKASPGRGFAKVYNNYRAVKSLQRLVDQRKPAAIISFITSMNLVTLCATLHKNVPVIVAERNHPAYTRIDWFRHYLRKWLYPKASYVVCQTEQILNFFITAGLKNGAVIPNPVIDSGDYGEPEITLPQGHLLLAAGNMSKQKVHQKGFDLLIPLFQQLAGEYQKWSLIILGEGTERASLQEKVNQMGLAGRIILPGNVKNIKAVFAHGDIFVMPSRYEGFPNALCEAMAAGLPGVSFDCPTGPGEIIRDEFDGKLVPVEDEESLKIALKDLMSNNEKRKIMGNNAREITQRYSIDKIMEQWEALFDNRA